MTGTGFAVWFFMRPETSTTTATASSSAAAPAAITVIGAVTLQRGQFVWNSQAAGCQGLSGFADIRPGTQVTVTDASGKVVAVGSLDQGTAEGITEEGGLSRATSCSLPFKVSGVPRGAGPYGVEVSHRGVLHYPERDLDTQALTLGFS
jgi:hypothetical protein